MRVTAQDIFYYYLSEVRKSEVFRHKEEDEQAHVAAILTEWTIEKVQNGDGNPHM